MVILGINAHHADASAAIFVDGQMVAAIEEERFRRIKHWAGFPSMSVAFCLKEAGISLEQVDHVAIGRDPGAKTWQKIRFALANPLAGIGFFTDRLKNGRKVASIEAELQQLSGMGVNDANLPRIHQVEHHRSHLASAFFASAFEDAAVVSIDGSGDFSTVMTASGHHNQLTVLDSIDFPHSLGIFYTAFTQLLGFPHYGDEYKVMGLAPYGTASHLDALKKVVRLEDKGRFSLDLSYFREAHKGFVTYGEEHVPLVPPLFGQRMEEEFGPARKNQEQLSAYHKDLAASVQRMTETVIFHVLEHVHQTTGSKNLCLAGGVAQNSVANGKITRNTGFESVYVPSAGHDAGISMGAALYVQHQVLHYPRQGAIYSAYTGSRFSEEEIEQLLKERQVSFTRLDDETLFGQVTDKLMEGGVVGWFTGRAEFGPRALGGRSILMDPRRTDAKEILNAKIKRRESFRPFAPSVLKGHVSAFFELDEPVPFMEKVYPIRADKRSLVPAVTHVDGTGRLQTVDEQVSPRYFRLIERFRQKTGIPMLVNTSFNENEPIVNTPAQALDCFLRTEMDMLVLEGFVVVRGG